MTGKQQYWTSDAPGCSFMPQGGYHKASEEGEGLMYHLSTSAAGNLDGGLGEGFILSAAASKWTW
jgi:hypothetical protein